MTDCNEKKFLDKIDCNFPYHDQKESERLIEEAANLSTNALFSVIEEICRIPESKKTTVETEELLVLLTSASRKLNHPIKEIIIDAADKMIRQNKLSVDEVILKMNTIKKYPGEYAALNILYFSCDDVEEKLEPICDNIKHEWRIYYEQNKS